MCPCNYVSENYTLEIATGNAIVVKENIMAMLCQVLKNGECPRSIRVAITDENTFLDQYQRSPCRNREPAELHQT
jgi:hypothetical protein